VAPEHLLPKSGDAAVQAAGIAPPQVPFPVVAIGASAGGLEGFTALLSELPAEPGMAFLLVQHLDPDHRSLLVELLSRSSRMPVHEASDGAPLEPNTVYIIPPDAIMALVDGHIHLQRRGSVPGQFMPIDHLMRSLAEQLGNRAVGVLLSGGGTDGALGMEAIKSAGGITFAQDESARHQSMPRSAISHGSVDFVLPPEQIAGQLTRIGNHSYAAPPDQAVETVPEDGDGLVRVFNLLRASSGVDFTHYKRSTIQRRIQRQMALHNLQSFDDYVHYLNNDPVALQALYQDLLIRVTNFFRDPEVYEALKTHVFPEIMRDRHPEAPVRIWVPGCATGEEVYSLAIALMEYLGDKAACTPIKILATDISEPALERARTGTYIENIEMDVSPNRLRRFFMKTGGHYQISKTIRDFCVFSRHDVTRDPPFSRLDLISCRNLLIYLDLTLQRRVVPLFHYALVPGGFLVLGKSEGISTFTDLFIPVEDSARIYRRKTTSARGPLDFGGYDVRQVGEVGRIKLREQPGWSGLDV
jgi:two-component system CheB/CheR fusion protein